MKKHRPTELIRKMKTGTKENRKALPSRTLANNEETAPASKNDVGSSVECNDGMSEMTALKNVMIP